MSDEIQDEVHAQGEIDSGIVGHDITAVQASHWLRLAAGVACARLINNDLCESDCDVCQVRLEATS